MKCKILTKFCVTGALSLIFLKQNVEIQRFFSLEYAFYAMIYCWALKVIDLRPKPHSIAQNLTLRDDVVMANGKTKSDLQYGGSNPQSRISTHVRVFADFFAADFGFALFCLFFGSFLLPFWFQNKFDSSHYFYFYFIFNYSFLFHFLFDLLFIFTLT